MSETQIRDTLFGDLPLTKWPSDTTHADVEPWASFVAARQAMEQFDHAKAVARLRAVLAMEALESRHYLEAWHALRELNVKPAPEQSKLLLGVVIEVHVGPGVDLLAAYADRSARYFNYSGAAVIWDRPDASLDLVIDRLFAASQTILDVIGPWSGRRPPMPGPEEARINLLAPSGLHFGQGNFADLSRDPLASPAVAAATELMTALVAKTNR